MTPRSLRERLLKGGVWALMGKVFLAFSWLLITGLLTRIASPSVLGSFFLLYSAVLFLSSIASLGLGQTLTRRIASDLVRSNGEGVATIAYNAFLCTLVALGLAALSIGLFGRRGIQLFFTIELEALDLFLLTIWLASTVYQRLISEFFRGLHDIRLASLFGNILSFALALCGLLIYEAVGFSFGLRELISIFAGAQLFAVLVGGMVSIQRISRFPQNWQWCSFELLSESWPLFVADVVYFVMTQADMWLVGWFCAKGEVALYGTAVKMLALISMPLSVSKMFAPPMIAELYSEKRFVQLEKVLRGISSVVFFPALIVSVVFLVFGKELLAFLFGGFYGNAYEVLAILALGEMVYAVTGNCDATLAMTNQRRSLMWITLFAAILTVLVGGVGGAIFGVYGVAVGTAVAFSAHNILMLFATRVHLGIWTHSYLRLSQLPTVFDELWNAQVVDTVRSKEAIE